MTAVDQSPGATGTEAGAGTGDDDAARPTPVDRVDLVTQIRQLAGCDPADVQRIVDDVLAALDRVAGGRHRGPLPPESRPAAGADEGGRTADPG